MTSTCGHLCCQIATNPYHVHTSPAASCTRCAVAVDDLPRPERLGLIAAGVLAHVAPEIPGLPRGEALDRLVAAEVRTVCEAADSDPEISALAPQERALVLIGRIGLALAFPAPP